MEEIVKKIIVVNANTPLPKRHLFYDDIRAFLNDLSCNYPYFDEWLEHCFEEVESGKRSIVVCDVKGATAGVAILKDEEKEKKICTFRVDKNYRHIGVGSLLLDESRRILGEDFPLITVSDEHINDFMGFLTQYGFKLHDKKKSLYRQDHYEFFFNQPFRHEYVLLAVRPKYARKILSGEKTVEFRKVCFSGNIKKVYVYSAHPEKRVIGYFVPGKIIEDSPTNLWQEFSSKGCISREEFFEYFNGSICGYGISINKVVELEREVSLEELFGTKKKPPQNYYYIDNAVVIGRLRYYATKTKRTEGEGKEISKKDNKH